MLLVGLSRAQPFVLFAFWMLRLDRWLCVCARARQAVIYGTVHEALRANAQWRALLAPVGSAALDFALHAQPNLGTAKPDKHGHPSADPTAAGSVWGAKPIRLEL